MGLGKPAVVGDVPWPWHGSWSWMFLKALFNPKRCVIQFIAFVHGCGQVSVSEQKEVLLTGNHRPLPSSSVMEKCYCTPSAHWCALSCLVFLLCVKVTQPFRLRSPNLFFIFINPFHVSFQIHGLPSLPSSVLR